MQLDAGSDFAGYNYLVLGSLSGTKPAQHFGRIRLALVRDTYFTFLFTNPNTLVQGSIGILDDRGRAVARFVLPRSSLEVPVGLQVQHAFVVFRIGQPMLYAASNTGSLLLR